MKKTKLGQCALTTGTREIIKAPIEKTDTGNHFAVFAPLFPQFLERLER